MRLTDGERIVESLLFVAGEPLPLSALAAALDQEAKTTRALIEGLQSRYAAEERGIQILELDGAYQMCSHPDSFEYLKKLYQGEKNKPLSQTLLETLAIIAYKQPVTKGQIEEIRGVNADHAVSKLMEFGLVREAGRLDTPGKPLLFATTESFLKHFSLSGLKALPPLAVPPTEPPTEATEADV